MCERCEEIRPALAKAERLAKEMTDTLTKQRIYEYAEDLRAQLAALKATHDKN